MNSGEALTIFPNPASDVVHLEYTGARNRNLLIEIIDSSGKLIEELYRGAHIYKTIISREAGDYGLASGIYLCRVISGSKTITGRLILQ